MARRTLPKRVLKTQWVARYWLVYLSGIHYLLFSGLRMWDQFYKLKTGLG